MDAFKKLFDTFVGIIVEAVMVAMGPRMEAVEKDVKTLHDSGAALLALNLDNDDFKSKMKDFISNEVDDWYHSQDGALWSESEITAHAESAVEGLVPDEDKVGHWVRDAIGEEISEAISAHERGKEHFDYRHEFEDAVNDLADKRIKLELDDVVSDAMEKPLRELAEMRELIAAMQKTRDEGALQRSQLKALLLAAAGMVDSMDAAKGGV
jgi:hypothetical protein